MFMSPCLVVHFRYPLWRALLIRVDEVHLVALSSNCLHFAKMKRSNARMQAMRVVNEIIFSCNSNNEFISAMKCGCRVANTQ